MRRLFIESQRHLPLPRPIIFRCYAIRFQSVFHRHHRVIPRLHDGVGLHKIPRRKFEEIGRNEKILRTKALNRRLHVLFGENIHHLPHDAHDAVQFLAAEKRRSHVDRNNARCPQFARLRYREIVREASVHKERIPEGHRRKCPGNRHRRTHRLRQRHIFREHHLGPGNKVGGHRGIGNGKIREIFHMVYGPRDARQKNIEFLRRNHSGRKRHPCRTHTDFRITDALEIVCLTAPCERRPVRARRKHLGPVHSERNRPNFVCAVPRGITASDHRTHTRRSKDVHSDVQFFQGFEGPDMRKPAGTAAR